MKKVHYSWYIVFISGLLMFGMSAQQMAQAVFIVEIADSLHVGMGVISLAFSTNILLLIGMAPLAAKLYQKYPAKSLACIAVVAQGGSILLLSSAKSVVTVILSCTLECFSVVSFLNILPAVLIKRWFKDRGQYAFNIILFISMLGGVVFTPIASAIIEAATWRIAYMVLAGFILLIEFPLVIIFLKEYPAQLGLEPFEDPNTDKNSAINNRPAMNADVTVKSSWRSKDFYLVCLYTVSLTYAATLQTHMVKHLVSLGFSTNLGARVVTAGLVGGLIGRVIMTYASEKFGTKATNTVYCGIGIIAAIALCYARNTNTVFVIAMGFLFGLAIRTTSVQSTVMRYTVFGASGDFSRIIANMTIVTGIVTSSAGTVYGFMYDLTGSYSGGFTIAVIACAISILLANMLLKNKKQMTKSTEPHAA